MTLSDWYKKYVALREKAVVAAYSCDEELLGELNEKFLALPTFCCCEGCVKDGSP